MRVYLDGIYKGLIDILLVFVPVIVGTGLIIKSAFEKHGKKSYEND